MDDFNPVLLRALQRLVTAAFARDNVAGDPISLLNAKAELYAAAKHGQAVIGVLTINNPMTHYLIDRRDNAVIDTCVIIGPHSEPDATIIRLASGLQYAVPTRCLIPIAEIGG